MATIAPTTTLRRSKRKRRDTSERSIQIDRAAAASDSTAGVATTVTQTNAANLATNTESLSWLLSGDPIIRAHALRNAFAITAGARALLGDKLSVVAKEDDNNDNNVDDDDAVSAALRASNEEGWVAQLTSLQNEGSGTWTESPLLYTPKWTSTFYSSHQLVSMGCDPRNAALVRAVRLLVDGLYCVNDGGFTWKRGGTESEDCVVGMLLRMACYVALGGSSTADCCVDDSMGASSEGDDAVPDAKRLRSAPEEAVSSSEAAAAGLEAAPRVGKHGRVKRSAKAKRAGPLGDTRHNDEAKPMPLRWEGLQPLWVPDAARAALRQTPSSPGPSSDAARAAVAAAAVRPIDPRLHSVAHFLETAMVTDGGWNCRRRNTPDVSHSSFNTTLSCAEGMLLYKALCLCHAGEVPTLPGAAGSVDWPTGALPLSRIDSMLSSAAEFLLSHRLYKSYRTGEAANAQFAKFAFPYDWHGDALRAFEYLAAGGVMDARMLDTVELAASKCVRVAVAGNGSPSERTAAPGLRWNAMRRYSGKQHFVMEGPRDHSRWTTMRVLGALGWWAHNGGRVPVVV